MSKGWIKLHRSLLDWEWYDDNNTKILFLHLLLKANHKDKSYRGKVIKKGCLLTGRQLLSMETGLSIMQVRTSLSKLKSTNEITIKSSSQGTEIQINNYKDYQEVTSELTDEQPTSNQRVTTNKNVKNIKNGRESSSVRKFGKTEFLEWFNKTRTEHLKQPSNFKVLTYYDQTNLSELTKNYTGEDFVKAFKNMIKDGWAKTNNKVTPDHFLKPENFNKYLNTNKKQSLN